MSRGKNVVQNHNIKTRDVQWTLEIRTQSVPRGGSTFNLFDFRVKFPHKK